MVVHDHPGIRDGLASCLGLERDMEVIATASSCEQALEIAAALRPDLVLIGRSTPTMGGTRATQALVDAQPDVLVVILSATAGAEFMVQALQSGALGYLLLETPPPEMAHVLRSLVRGRRPLTANP
jgi:DNA-binding NarL/FixJ family response regulator